MFATRHATQRKTSGILAFVGLLLICLCSNAQADDLSRAQQRLQHVQKKISAIQSQINHNRTRRADVNKQLRSLEHKIGDIGAQLHDLDTKISARKRSLAKLKTKVRQRQVALSGQMQALSGMLRAAYRNGRPSRLRLLLSQQNPAVVGRMLTYYDYYTQAQSRVIAQVRDKLQSLRDARADVAAQQANLRADRKQQQQLLAHMRASRGARQQTLATIETHLHNSTDNLHDLKTDQQELRSLISKLRGQLADIPANTASGSFTQRKGQLPHPVQGRVIAAFGQPKAGGRLHWKGVWLAAKRGAPVHAVAPGRVVYIGWMQRYGLIIILDHGHDYYTVYGHNQSIYAKLGSHVRAGEIIAAAGDSGGHTTSGVYFEIRHGRTPVNPARWLRS